MKIVFPRAFNLNDIETLFCIKPNTAIVIEATAMAQTTEGWMKFIVDDDYIRIFSPQDKPLIQAIQGVFVPDVTEIDIENSGMFYFIAEALVESYPEGFLVHSNKPILFRVNTTGQVFLENA